MNQDTVRRGMITAGLVNILGIPLFSLAFTGAESIAALQPAVMSLFGQVMIMVWGLAYLASAKIAHQQPFLLSVFCLEKAAYVVMWLHWFWTKDSSFGEIYSQSLMTGLFYSLYGLNDFLFMLFFGRVALAGAGK